MLASRSSTNPLKRAKKCPRIHQNCFWVFPTSRRGLGVSSSQLSSASRRNLDSRPLSAHTLTASPSKANHSILSFSTRRSTITPATPAPTTQSTNLWVWRAAQTTSPIEPPPTNTRTTPLCSSSTAKTAHPMSTAPTRYSSTESRKRTKPWGN